MLKLYNSLTKNLEEFIPRKESEVSIYVCGVTVYDRCHIGHARVFVVFDVIARYLRSLNYKVNFIRNITDIDDKIIKRAFENNEEITTLTQRYTKLMQEDMQKLGVLPVSKEPKATECIDEIISLIKTLMDKGYAYQASNNDVYFRVANFKDYGKLSSQDLNSLQLGARVEVNEAKESPLDFVLWKSSKEGEPSWDSPWGAGRPGWHIECSAMSLNCLGETFDIHGGGADLLFPHHENEIAQSEAATDKKFVNYWMHVGHVQVNKEKMSKSLNNFFTIEDVLKEFPAEVIRYFLVSSVYRNPVNYSKENLASAKNSLDRLYTAMRELSPIKFTSIEEIIEKTKADEILSKYAKSFDEAMQNDFNAPIAFAVLFDLVKEINKLKEKSVLSKANLYAGVLIYLANIFGLLEQSPKEYFKSIHTDSKSNALTEEAIEQLIAKRAKAKEDKDFVLADRLRDELSEKGVLIEDTKDGVVWKYK